MVYADVYSLDDYLALPDDTIPWLVEPLIPSGGICCLHGLAKTRKSFLSLQLARDICNGHPFLGFPTKAGRVMYLQLDTPRSLWKLRIKTLVQSPDFGITPEGRTRLFLGDTEHMPFPFHVLQPTVRQWLRGQVEKVKPDLVILDVIRKIFQGNDNDSDIIEQVLNAVKEACKPAAVLLVAHSKKAAKDFDGGTIGEIRGSGAQGASYDTIFRLIKGKQPTLSIEGRATMEQTVKLVNRPDLLFDLTPDGMFRQAVLDILTEDYPNTRQRALALQGRTGEDFARCQTAIRREMERRGDEPHISGSGGG